MHEKKHDERNDHDEQRHPVRTLWKLMGFALMTTALVKELRTPREQRTWHGVLFDFLPYDLRPPTPSRLRAAWWNPEDNRLFPPRAFGIGWAVNLAQLRRVISS